MLQSMRDNLKGTAAIIVAGFFGFIMVIGGIDFFAGSSGGATDKVAEVNGEKITNLDLQRAIQNRRNMILSQYGDNAPADLLTDERLRGPVLQQLVTSSVLRQAAQDSGMVMSTAAIDRETVQVPAFQVNGTFDPQMFRDALRRMGYSPASFRQVMERDLVLQQYADSVSGTAIATRADAEEVVEISMEERDFDYVVLPVTDMLGEVSVSEQEVQDYYAENEASFKRPEQVAIEYIELKPEVFAENIDVSPQDVRAQYEQEAANYQASERRRAAHILLEDADEAKIAEIQSRLEAGEDFAALAREYSDDVGSSEEGGDLGFTDGDVFPEAFEEALAQLDVGGVSGPVETDAGTHFIKLLEVEGVEPPSFEEREAAITAQLRNAEAEREFVAALGRLADLAYNAETLAGPAEELGVSLQQLPLFGRQGGPGIAANDKVVAAAFAPEVMLDGNTSDVLNLTEDHSVVLRVTEHQPAGTYPLEEVRERIVEQLKREKASMQLAERAEAFAEQVRSGAEFAEVAKEQQLSLKSSDNTRRGGVGQRGQIISEAFAMAAPSSGSAAIKVFATDSGDQVILQLRDVREGDFKRQTPEQRQALRQQLASLSGSAELAAVQRYLADRADIEVVEAQ
ncbi:SurA N-terminal domain-containing protein [Microbulbifer yueqingensis]|uniref:Periplasmic chaperone PpiD n=1 Tax=Microbulbifer yueqingensis TaxID=658219 RepID=A0A1G9AHJ2_9GAMM|nr:SurA N-terminal domain-containing protein [Microbulbifer yueqingensis]SDK26294.1 peptidyl-prolyl cis-trans isomerase D [Microbulbifer yueqingensis]